MPAPKKINVPSDYYEQIRLQLQRRIVRALRLARHIADFGCGNCELSQYLAQALHQNVIGIDISKNSLPKKKHEFPNIKLRCICHNAERLSFLKKESMDAVVMKYALHEMTQPHKILKEAYRIIRPGGTILIVEFPKDSLAQKLWNEDYFTPNQLRKMLKNAGFCEVKVKLLFQSQIEWAQGWKPTIRGQTR